jgi:hypothetical protein
VSGAAVVRPRVAAGAERDAVAEPLPAVGAAEPSDAEAQRRVVRRDAAAPRPARLPSSPREARPPWLAPRRAAQVAHAKRRWPTVLPSRQSWQAAGCEGLS